MSPTKPFLRALAGETLDTPPIWLMRQAGRYLPEYRAMRAEAGSFLDLCYTPSYAAEVTLQPIRRYDFDAAIVFSDILVVPDALGRSVSFVAGEGPRLLPLTSREEIESLDLGQVTTYLQPVFDAVRRIAAELPSNTALIGFCGAPWTVATYMIEGGGSKDYAETRKWAFGRPGDLQALIDVLVEASIAYLSAQVEAGAEALQIFDSWAGVLPEEQFRRFVIAPTRRIVEALRDKHPGVPIIGFPRGAGVLYQAFVQETEVNAVSLDQTVPLEWAATALQPWAAVQGNLDPLLLVVGGQMLDAAVDRIKSVLGDGPFVFNLGHGIVPETPPEHVSQLISRVRS